MVVKKKERATSKGGLKKLRMEQVETWSTEPLVLGVLAFLMMAWQISSWALYLASSLWQLRRA